jgi:hypothetical protein
MKVVGRQYIGVHQDAEISRAPETLRKTPSVMIVAENHAPVPNRLRSILTSLSATPWESLPAADWLVVLQRSRNGWAMAG